MANTFVSHQSANITTDTTVYTGQASTQATVIGLTVANVSASPATASVTLNGVHVIKNAPIPVGGSLVVVGGDQKLVVEATDTVNVSSDVAVDVITSVLEIS